MPFYIVNQDITTMDVDVVVNAANTALQKGSGVCGAIFNAAGAHTLQAACNQLAPIKTGEAVITPGFQLRAKHIIHTAGPTYSGGLAHEDVDLYACYHNSLKLAKHNGCESIAFPLISSGIYGYPIVEAIGIARSAIQAFLKLQDMSVYLVIFDRDIFELSENRLSGVDDYLEHHYVGREDEAIEADDNLVFGSYDQLESRSEKHALQSSSRSQLEKPKTLHTIMEALDEPFSTTLLRLIDSKGMTDVNVYKRANLDRKLFSKIRANPSYRPSKKTALAFAIALELSLVETNKLLKCAGYALSHSHKFDVIVEYFILNEIYDIFEINEVLFKFDQPLLGG